MCSCSMRARSVASSLPTWITITDREPISPLGKTRPSGEGFSRQKWDRSWRCPRSAGCITATNDGPPETPPSLNIGVDGSHPGAIPLRRKADALPFWRQEQPSPTWQPRDTLSAATLLHLFYRDRVFGRDNRP